MQFEETIPTVVMLYFGQIWPLLENPGFRHDLQAVCSFLTSFLTEMILKKSSNEATSTPNR